MERIWGPVNGFYLAAYAAPADDRGHFASYAKVCWRRPESYWDADCAFKVFGGEHHRCAESAIDAVVLDAANEVTQLPSRSRRLAGQRRRRFALPRLIASSLLRQRMA